MLIKTFLTDIKEEWLKEKAEAFCKTYWTKLMRPAGLLAVAEEINRHAGSDHLFSFSSYGVATFCGSTWYKVNRNNT